MRYTRRLPSHRFKSLRSRVVLFFFYFVETCIPNSSVSPPHPHHRPVQRRERPKKPSPFVFREPRQVRAQRRHLHTHGPDRHGRNPNEADASEVAAPAASGVAAPAASEAAAPAAGHSPMVSILQDLMDTWRLGCCRSTAWHAKPQDVALVKNLVVSRRGCTPHGESRVGRIPCKINLSVPWLPDAVRTINVSPTVAGCRTKVPLRSTAVTSSPAVFGRSRGQEPVGPGEGPEIFESSTQVLCSHITRGREDDKHCNANDTWYLMKYVDFVEIFILPNDNVPSRALTRK